MGIIHASKISAKTRHVVPSARFHSKRWRVNLLYGLILLFAVFPSFTQYLGLKALTLEGLLVIGLLLIGHGLIWEFLMEKSD